MTHADFHAAILDEPDDDLTRLVFADWLDDRGEGDRAEFVRLGVLWDRALASPLGSPAHAEGRGLGARTQAAFERAWPAEYKLPHAVPLGHRFGLATLGAHAAGRGHRLDLPWLPDAIRRGWIGAVRMTGGTPPEWARGECAGLTLDATLSYLQTLVPVLNYPDLVSLALEPGDLTAAASRRLPACARLRTVTLYGGDPAAASRALHQLVAVPKLRRLDLHAPLALGQSVPVFPALARLKLYRNGLTDPGVERFAVANPRVSIGLPT